MKTLKTILFIFTTILAFRNLITAQTIPNAGFETWTGSGCNENPELWSSVNASICALGNPVVDRATGADAHSGNSALKTVTVHIGFPINRTAPGLAVTGTVNQQEETTEGGFIVTSRPNKLTGWYKYAPQGTDTCRIELTLWRRNGGTYELVGEALFTQNTSVSTYTKFEATINYLNANTPDSAKILVISSNPSSAGSANDGSALFVDDLEFVSCAGFSASVGTTDVTTNGGSDGIVTAIVSGGATPYNYAWSSGQTSSTVNGLTADTYCVTVTDNNGCTTSACGVVSSPSCSGFSVAVSTTSITYVGNNDGTASVAESGGTGPYTYLWSTGETTQAISGLTPDDYCVTVTDANSCVALDCGTVSDIDCSGFSISTSTTDASSGTAADGSATVSETGGTSPFTYNWSNGGTAQTITGVVSDTYDVTVTDNLGCTATASANVNFTVGVANSNQGLFNIYPNPASGVITVELSNHDPHQFTLTDLSGKVVFHTALHSGKNTLELYNSSKGIYVYSVKNIATGKTAFGKLVAE